MCENMDEENSRASSCFPSELKKTKHWRQPVRLFCPGLQKVMHAPLLPPKNTNANQPTAQAAKTNRPSQKHLNVGHTAHPLCFDLKQKGDTAFNRYTGQPCRIRQTCAISTTHSINSPVTFGLHSTQPCVKFSSWEGKKEWALIAGKHGSGSDLTMLHKG